MHSIDIKTIQDIITPLLKISFEINSYSYDEKADVLYLNFKKPSHADDSELTDDDIIIRYEGNEIVGITILHASERKQSR